jgi:hypothetical protein
LNRLHQIEQEVLRAGREWMRAQLEKRLQEECLACLRRQAVEMVSAKTGEELENTRWRSMGLDTVVGKVKLKVHQGYCPEEGWVCPTRQAWGLKPYERKTPELQARLAYTATVVGSYAEAEKLARIWGTPVSDLPGTQQTGLPGTRQTGLPGARQTGLPGARQTGLPGTRQTGLPGARQTGTSIHQCVQELGPRAQKLVLPPAVPAPREAPFDLVLMMDGWLTRQRGPDWSAGPRKKNPERVEWKEIKSAVIYRLAQRAENTSGRGLSAQPQAEGAPLGSGAVESLAKQLQRRMRGGGQFWERSGLSNLLRLSVLVKNNDLHLLWN